MIPYYHKTSLNIQNGIQRKRDNWRKTMKKYYKKHKLLAFSWGFWELVVAFNSILLSLMMQFFVAIATGENGKTVKDGAICLVLFLVYNYVTTQIFYYMKEKFKCRIVEDIRNDLFTHIMGQNFTGYYKKNSGEYLSVLNNDVKTVEENAIQTTFTMIQYGGMLIMASIYVWRVNWVIAILMLVIALISFFLPKLFSKNLDKKNEEFLKETSIYNEKIKDAFTGFEVIRSYGIGRKINSMHCEWNAQVQKKKYESSFSLDHANNMTQTMNVMIQLCMLLVSAYLVILGKITVSQMVLLMSMQNNIFYPVFALVEGMNSYKSTAGVRKRILEITSKEWKEETGVIEPFQKEIEFRDVTFGYEEGKEILHRFSVTFEKGKKYALVGNSGSGKSTILRLLLRYYDGYKGEILIDGKEIRSMAEEGVRQQCALIPQNVFMFDDTLYNNITLYRDYSMEEVENVVRMAGLTNMVSQLKEGLGTRVSENGNNFSGGEKQRIAIARALLLQRKIIIMDEATANVDEKTAVEIENIVLKNPEITCICVTHHLLAENKSWYDKIIRME